MIVRLVIALLASPWYGFLAVLATVPLLAAGGQWRYLDDGSNPGAAWNDPEFDDSAWPTGQAQFGYGEDDEATQIGFGDDHFPFLDHAKDR